MASAPSSASDKYLTEEQRREKQLSGMTPSEKALYERDRARYFKGTIAVCVIYGTLALGLFLLAIFSARGREILAGDLVVFTGTFIGGMLFIIVVLTIQVINFRPPLIDRRDENAMSCPDFWTLEKTAPPAGSATDAAYQLQWVCKKPGNVNAAGATAAIDTTVGSIGANYKANYHPKLAGSSSGNYDCTAVYPMFMSSADMATYPDAPNRIRCDYAKTCGVSWSAVCPQIP